VSFAVDTNVLLRSIDVDHAAQPIAQNAMIRLRNDGESLSIFSQNLIEFWAVATRPIANNGLGLSIAQTEEELTNLKSLFTLLPDTPDILPQWEQLVVKHQVMGKQAHDARLVAAMNVHKVTHLLTFNTADFKRYSEIIVVNPSTLN
jgi:predicted nucleic acid-binding protein